jgi:hypothetical protein
MGESAKQELAVVFESLFAANQNTLTGTEEEIVVLKAHARRWFELGVRESGAVFYKHQKAAIQEAMADVDANFAFLNNMR